MRRALAGSDVIEVTAGGEFTLPAHRPTLFPGVDEGRDHDEQRAPAMLPCSCPAAAASSSWGVPWAPLRPRPTPSTTGHHRTLDRGGAAGRLPLPLALPPVEPHLWQQPRPSDGENATARLRSSNLEVRV
jgi:hypothetical protein